MFPVPTKAMVQKSDKIVSIVLQGSQVSWCCIQRNDEEETFLVKQLEFKPVEFNSRQHFHSSLTEVGRSGQDGIYIFELQEISIMRLFNFR